jgi:metallo-beta-lactamase family protein
MSLTFLGAAGTVPVQALLEVDGRILVDCGLSGAEGAAAAQLGAAADRPGHDDAVILTHAHLDHCGYLPRLVSRGIAGAFSAPRDEGLCSLVLPDSAHIQEEDARDANRHGFTKHQPALPLYTTVDAARRWIAAAGGYDRRPLWTSRSASGRRRRPGRQVSSGRIRCRSGSERV